LQCAKRNQPDGAQCDCFDQQIRSLTNTQRAVSGETNQNCTTHGSHDNCGVGAADVPDIVV
jgi:hypothetical protein